MKNINKKPQGIHDFYHLKMKTILFVDQHWLLFAGSQFTFDIFYCIANKLLFVWVASFLMSHLLLLSICILFFLNVCVCVIRLLGIVCCQFHYLLNKYINYCWLVDYCISFNQYVLFWYGTAICWKGAEKMIRIM